MSNLKDNHKPMTEENMAIKVAKKAIFSGVFEIGRAASAGITKKAGASNAPINFKATAMKKPTDTKKIN